MCILVAYRVHIVAVFQLCVQKKLVKDILTGYTHLCYNKYRKSGGTAERMAHNVGPITENPGGKIRFGAFPGNGSETHPIEGQQQEEG